MVLMGIGGAFVGKAVDDMVALLRVALAQEISFGVFWRIVRANYLEITVPCLIVGIVLVAVAMRYRRKKPIGGNLTLRPAVRAK
jgi:hypothetical protein